MEMEHTSGKKIMHKQLILKDSLSYLEPPFPLTRHSSVFARETNIIHVVWRASNNLTAIIVGWD